ncbi:porin family protein [Xanthobacter dioxanivorans]|uniref:Porin family protein n=1 Tax=Xanthobacter dioxanivorans TaxID=2528964 RepID=A0A974PPM8_9HYPH|nr:outer membrane protein [Xanthobacter dioxanivorans]QRG07452.1 porin family protein [Xanthobacter dioxanivorans]
MRLRLLASTAVLAGLAAGLGLAAPAAAADLSGRYAPVAYAQPAPVFTWTGFYLGANVGYGWGSSGFDSPAGAVGGLQAGYNFQFASPFVLGVETDFNLSGISGGTFGLDYFGTVRARAGYAFDRVLVYGTGGFAYGQGSLDFFGLSSSATQTGWTLGAGAEFALDRNWSARAEYLYVDLGSATFPTLTGPVTTGLDANILRAGVNFRF